MGFKRDEDIKYSDAISAQKKKKMYVLHWKYVDFFSGVLLVRLQSLTIKSYCVVILQ